ncbi:MAG: class I SAM-dependent methyltransferase [Vicinamibacterales bacterium]
MGIRELLARLLPLRPSPPAGGHDDDFDWLQPPDTVEDAGRWDRYWQEHVGHGLAGLVHLFVDDGDLVDVMRATGLRRVLCVGNGVSQEPRALAWAGFDVTALDLSPLATATAAQATPPDAFLQGLVGGRSGSPGGAVNFVTGSLMDPACCPGPFDLVIERRTLQLWPDAGRAAAMRAVADRLAPTGIFFSHSHDGGWTPPAPRRHVTEPWFREQGWPITREPAHVTGRIAWLFTTTG